MVQASVQKACGHLTCGHVGVNDERRHGRSVLADRPMFPQKLRNTANSMVHRAQSPLDETVHWLTCS